MQELSKLAGQCDKKLKSGTCPIIQILQRDADSQWTANESKKRRSLHLLRESEASSFLKEKISG